MKRIGGLYDQIWDRGNLALAFWRAKRGKRASQEIRDFVATADRRLNQISLALKQEVYQFGSYQAFHVRDTKSRQINAPDFQDRVVHHAVINVVGPILEKGALAHSYACRQGRGQHAAIRQAATWTRRQDWYGKIDIEKFYDNVDQQLLAGMLERRFSEKRLLRLFRKLLATYSTTEGKGIPIGGLTSQYLGNFYLDQFDRQMKATQLVPRYLRYMDDIVVWTRRDAHNGIRDHVNSYLRCLNLKAKNGGQWNACRQGVPFLGFVIYPDRIRLNRQGRKRLRRKYRVLQKAFELGTLTDREYQSRLTALFAHPQSGNDIAWRNAVCEIRQDQEV